jgi:hypothetical protein
MPFPAFLDGGELPDHQSIGHEQAAELLSQVYSPHIQEGASIVPEVNE